MYARRWAIRPSFPNTTNKLTDYLVMSTPGKITNTLSVVKPESSDALDAITVETLPDCADETKAMSDTATAKDASGNVLVETKGKVARKK